MAKWSSFAQLAELRLSACTCWLVCIRHGDKNIESHLIEKRVFKPARHFAKKARIESLEEYRRMYRKSIKSPDKFWAREARELIWQKRGRRCSQWKAPFAKWFVGGKLNVSENCLDRHLHGPESKQGGDSLGRRAGRQAHADLPATASRSLPFRECPEAKRIRKGDRVIIYMPMIPEAAIAMLACARIGAVHSVVFGGFSADSIRDRIADCGAMAVITADGGYRRGAIVPLKKNVDDALQWRDDGQTRDRFPARGQRRPHRGRPRRLVASRAGICGRALPAEPLDSEHPLFILYTSGSTGKPKGILHTTGGYLVGIYATTKYVFDLRDDDVYWCTADVGWVTGHSYVVYGPLANGATTLMYEGAPNWPEPDRFWRIVEEYGVTILYTAPTAIRAFIRWGDQWPQETRSVFAAPARHRSANRSIPKPGCGITRTSAAAAARSWIPGGRRKPARS